MKKIIFLFTTFFFLCGETYTTNFLISDYDFTNQKITYERLTNFIKIFPKTPITKDKLKHLYTQSTNYKINPIVILAKLEQENGLINNGRGTNGLVLRLKRAMGYGLFVYKKDKNGNKYRPSLGYSNQISGSCSFFREKFNEWKPKTVIEQLQNLGKITPKNASTYSLYRYCPVYGKYQNYGFNGNTYQKTSFYCVGNMNFSKIFYKFKQLESQTQ
jgi:hypothetical protein